MKLNLSHHSREETPGVFLSGNDKGVIVDPQGIAMRIVLEAKANGKREGAESRIIFPTWKEKCQAPGCARPARTKGYCPRHYQQVRRHGRLTPEREYQHREMWCVVDHCQALQVAKGYCYRHYQQVRRYGQLTPERERIYGRIGCQVRGCPNPHSARGYCQKHYMSYYYSLQKTVHDYSLPVGPDRESFQSAVQECRGNFMAIYADTDGEFKLGLPVSEVGARGGNT